MCFNRSAWKKSNESQPIVGTQVPEDSLARPSMEPILDIPPIEGEENKGCVEMTRFGPANEPFTFKLEKCRLFSLSNVNNKASSSECKVNQYPEDVGPESLESHSPPKKRTRTEELPKTDPNLSVVMSSSKEMDISGDEEEVSQYTPSKEGSVSESDVTFSQELDDVSKGMSNNEE